MALSPVCLSGEFYGEMSLMGYSPWGHKESDTTEHTYISRFLYLRITDILGQIIFCCEGCPVHCRMLSVPGLYSLDTNITPQIITIKKYLQTFSLGEMSCPDMPLGEGGGQGKILSG